MADTRGSSPSLLISFPIWIQTWRDLPTFQRTSGQLSSDGSNILPSHLKVYKPYIHSVQSSNMRLKEVSAHWLVIATSLLRHRIYVLRSHRCVRWCLSRLPAGMCIPHRLQQGSSSLLS